LASSGDATAPCGVPSIVWIHWSPSQHTRLQPFLDLWVQQWRKRRATGDMIVVRYADDTIVGFQHRREAERFLGDLKDRLAQFALSCICAALGSDAVQLPVAGMGDDPWLRGVGGRADPGPASRFCDRCRFGLYILWRETVCRRRPAVPVPRQV